MSGSRRQFQSRVEEQPVLEVAAGDEPHVAQPAVGDELAGVLVERVVAEVEVDRVDQAGRAPPRSTSSADSAAVIASGFSHTTCLPASRIARAWGTWRWLGEVTWTTSTAGSSRTASRRGIARGDAQRSGSRRAALRGAAEDAADLDADAAQRLDVDRADEARPDDGGADVGDPGHGHSTRIGDASV